MHDLATERRAYRRFKPKHGVEIVLFNPVANSALAGTPLNISRGGAYIRTPIPANPSEYDTIFIQIPALSFTLKKQCSVHYDRHEPNGNSCAVTFSNLLSMEEEEAVCSKERNARLSDIIKSDFDLLTKEIDYGRQSQLRSCLAVFVCISIWLIATISLGMTGMLQPSFWSVLGSSLPAVILLFGISIHSTFADFINQRTSYYALISHFYLNELLKTDYPGWRYFSLMRHDSEKKGTQKTESKKTYTSSLKSDVERKIQHSSQFEHAGSLINSIYSVALPVSCALLVTLSYLFVSPFWVYLLGTCAIIALISHHLYVRSLAKGSRSTSVYYIQWERVLLDYIASSQKGHEEKEKEQNQVA